jgi:hypothetical protein
LEKKYDKNTEVYCSGTEVGLVINEFGGEKGYKILA